MSRLRVDAAKAQAAIEAATLRAEVAERQLVGGVVSSCVRFLS